MAAARFNREVAMHWDWNAVLNILVAVATVVIRAAIVSPKSHEVALKIRTLADDAAAMIVSANPAAPWSAKVQAVIEKLDSMIPNIDPSVLESAATGALTRLGSTSAGSSGPIAP
jgi:hypothetical protein